VSVSTARLLHRTLRNAHRDALKSADDLDDEQLRWRPERGPQSIGWHLWHVARWDDHLIQRLGGEDVWTSERVAERWGWPEGLELGDEGAGTGLEDEAAAALRIPPKTELLEYVSAVFERSQRLVSGASEELLAELWQEGGRATKADAVLGFAGHDFEHLGMITALRGLLGLRGLTE
jgi:DinB family protein